MPGDVSILAGDHGESFICFGDNDGRLDSNLVIKPPYLFIMHPDAAGGNMLADGVFIVVSVNCVGDLRVYG